MPQVWCHGVRITCSAAKRPQLKRALSKKRAERETWTDAAWRAAGAEVESRNCWGAGDHGGPRKGAAWRKLKKKSKPAQSAAPTAAAAAGSTQNIGPRPVFLCRALVLISSFVSLIASHMGSSVLQIMLSASLAVALLQSWGFGSRSPLLKHPCMVRLFCLRMMQSMGLAE